MRLPPIFLRPDLTALLVYLVVLVAAYPAIVLLGASLQPALLHPSSLTGALPGTDGLKAAVNSFNLDLADPSYTLWPINRLIGRLIAGGEWPLWNPHQGAGEPLSAQFSTRAFFPYQIIENLAPTSFGDLFLLGRLWIAGALTYAFLRMIGLVRPAAFAGGLAYMLSGALVWFIWLEQMMNVAMCLPGLMAATVLIVRRPSGATTLLLAVAIALVLLGGQPETAIYVLTLSGIFMLTEIPRRLGDASMVLAAYGGAALLGFAMAAPLLLPFFEIVRDGFHLHAAGGDMGTRDWTPWAWIAAEAFPTLYTLPRPYVLSPLNGLWDHLGTYSGCVIPVIAAAAARLMQGALRRRMLLFAAVFLWMILKHHGLPPFLWIGALPAFDQAWSQRWAGPVLAFAISSTAALTLHGAAHRQTATLGADDAIAGLRLARFGAALGLLPLATIARSHSSMPSTFAFLLSALVIGAFVAALGWPARVQLASVIQRFGFTGIGVTLGSAAIAMAVAPAMQELPVAAITAIAAIPGLLICGVAIARPAAIAALAHRYGALGLTTWTLLAILLGVAIVNFPPTWTEQTAYVDLYTLAAPLIGLAAAASALVALNDPLPSRRQIRLCALIAVELIFLVPRGLDPASSGAVIALFAAAIIALALPLPNLTRFGLPALAVLAIGIVEHLAPSGFPQRRDPFEPQPFVEYLQQHAGYDRVTGFGGVLFPTSASALNLFDIHYIDAVALSHTQHFTETHLVERPDFPGSRLWFTGRPYRDFADFAPPQTQWYRMEAYSLVDGLPSPEMAVARSVQDLKSKFGAYSFLGLRYLAFPTWAAPVDNDLPLKLVHDGEVRVYENAAALPRAFVVHAVVVAENFAAAQNMAFSPEFNRSEAAVVEAAPALPPQSGNAATAAILAYSGNEVVVEATLERRGLLILTDVYAPGWEAEIDGIAAPIVRVNGLVRGVYLEPGQHRVTFRYRPRSFTLGIFAALASIALGLSLALAWRPSDRRIEA